MWEPNAANRIRKRNVLIIVAIVVASALCAVCISFCHDANASSVEGKPVFEVLREAGYEGSESEWYASLSDEQKAAIDIAYESDVSLGYKGTHDEWMALNVRARLGHDGDVIVVMPDGGEFAVPMSVQYASSMTSQASPTSATGQSDSVSPTDGDGPSASQIGQSSEEAAGGASSDTAPEVPYGDEATDSSNTSSPTQPSDPSLNQSSAAAPPANNALGALLAVGDVRAHAGDVGIAVPIRIENNPGILGLTISVSYDESAMTLRSVENGEAFKHVLTLTRSQSLGNGCLLTWDGVDLRQENIEDGAIAMLYFDVPDDAASGQHVVAIRSSQSAFDANLNEIVLSMQDGSVVIE